MATQSEVNQVVIIAQEYFPEDKITEFFSRLNEEIGKKTEDESLKQLLSSIKEIVAPPLAPPPLWLWGAFYTLIVIHFILVIAVATSFCLLPFLAPWYIALPIMVFIFFFSTTRVECQLTNLENQMRRRLGLKKIGGFIGHYMLKPTGVILRKRKLTREMETSENESLE